MTQAFGIIGISDGFPVPFNLGVVDTLDLDLFLGVWGSKTCVFMQRYSYIQSEQIGISLLPGMFCP